MNIPDFNNNFNNSRIKSESYIKKHFEDFYEYLLERYREIPDISFQERLYMYIHNLDEPVRCKVCNSYTKFNNLNLGYRTYCSSRCCNRDPDKEDKRKKSSMQKYGVSNPSQLTSIKNKVKQTKLERYGDENFNNRDKVKQTKLERYGDENYTNLEQAKQTKLERYGDKNYTNQEKRSKTNLQRYGSCSPLGNINIRNKVLETKLERYGDENYTNLEQAKQTKLERYGDENYTNPEQAKQTKLERYGDENFNNRDKAATTCLEKYGTRYYSNPEQAKQTKLERYGDSGFNNKEQIFKTYRENRINKIEELIDYTDKGWWIIKCPHPDCNLCTEKTFATPYSIYSDRKRLSIETCTKKLPIGQHNQNTNPEIFIRDILDKYNIKYICNDRKILGGKELDIYIPDRKLAIECNGVYWHSTDIIENTNYHINKWRRCKELGIQLITIWEDWIINKPDIIESIICNKLNIYKRRIYARCCTVERVDFRDCKDFLNRNHIQGSSRASIYLALKYRDEIVSVMTFTKKRGMMGNRIKIDGEWELSRFCNLIHTVVVGGASKLLKYFKDNFNWESIYSFSSNDISNGHLYEMLGFSSNHKINRSSWYIRENRRYHRSTLAKDSIVRKGLRPNKIGWKEKDVAKELGYLQIYDSGQIKWILKKEV